ncbi:MAG: hypothetical protein ABW007_08755 [Chitinophagaceae bacterium]
MVSSIRRNYSPPDQALSFTMPLLPGGTSLSGAGGVIAEHPPANLHWADA